ncbi:4Fe-4S dicluster domain-containing protein [Candidatus Dependentiae bacterium]|nr:4Fe-4S dicluster domain-containing protein [Candidatus Dependentiae bacterium]
MIDLNEADLEFRKKVIAEPGGENLMKCFACGTCTAGCPVRAVDDDYNPRKIIHLIILGQKQRILESDFIWLCSSCYTCAERCPQGVRIADIMNAIKNVAVKEGYIHPSYIAQIRALAEKGALYEIGDFENKKRKKHGLPELNYSTEFIEEVFESTGLKKFE